MQLLVRTLNEPAVKDGQAPFLSLFVHVDLTPAEELKLRSSIDDSVLPKSLTPSGVWGNMTVNAPAAIERFKKAGANARFAVTNVAVIEAYPRTWKGEDGNDHVSAMIRLTADEGKKVGLAPIQRGSGLDEVEFLAD